MSGHRTRTTIEALTGAGAVDTAVDLHRAAFADSALTLLGPGVLRRHYRWLFEGPHRVTALVARDPDGRPVGLMVGGVFNGSTVGFLRREWRALAIALVRRPRLLLSGDVRARLTLGARLLARRGGSRPGPERPSRVPERSFGILVIGVDPRVQGEGVGGALLDAAGTHARAAGFVRMHLTARGSGEETEGYYRSRGWSRLPVPDGEWDRVMVLELGPEEPNEADGPEGVDG